jgi:drug/metabolite transporter, DME family
VLGASRLAVAAPLLLASAAAARTPLKPVGWTFLPAGLCIAAYQLAYFAAVPRAGVAATALLAICSAPLFVAALAWVLLGERPTGSKAAALGVGLAGGALLIAGSGRRDAAFGTGASLALGAGFVWSVYVVLTKRAGGLWKPHALTALTFTTAAVLLLPVLATSGAETSSLWERAWPLLIYLAAVPTALAYWLYTAGLRRSAASSAAIVGLLEPVTATVLGLSLFAERLAPFGWAGAVLLVAAVTILAVFTRDRPSTEPSSPAASERAKLG